MKVCIYGAGAIGAHIGVLLKLAGVDVSLVSRGANLEAIHQAVERLQMLAARAVAPPATAHV